jgi:Tfp pilus assembly protein PilO
MKLDRAEAKYTNVRYEYADMENQLIGLSKFEERLGELQNQFDEQKQKWFTRQQALNFFENINAMALTHNLRPISRMISEPKTIFDDKENEEAQPQDLLLRTQSAKISVTGDYFDIVEFVSDLTLTERRQKVIIKNVHIALAPGDNYYPRASLNVVLLVDLSQEDEA